MHNPIDKIAHTTAFDTPVVEHWLEREKEIICFLDLKMKVNVILDGMPITSGQCV